MQDAEDETRGQYGMTQAVWVENLPANSANPIQSVSNANVLMMGMDTVHPRAIPTGARERADIVLAIAAGTDVLESVFVFGVMSEVLRAVLTTETIVVNAVSLAMPSLQTGNGSADRAVENRAETGGRTLWDFLGHLQGGIRSR